MVMRNPHDSPGGSGGRDDLPPRIRERLRGGLPGPAGRPRLPPAPAADRDWAHDLAWFLLLSFGVVVGSILYILAALFYIRP